MGYKVLIIDNLFRGRLQYIEDLLNAGKASFVNGDIRDLDLVRKAIHGSSYVFHDAAVCINYSLAAPEESMDINLRGSFNVFKAAVEAGVKKVIFASSASVYGNPIRLPMSEDHPLNPITPYCVSKIADEFLLKMFSNQGLKYIALRNFNVYGPRQSTDAYYTSVILSFVKKISNNSSPVILGDGSQSMDFVNIHDVVDANILAMESDVENEVFNVGSGTSTSVRELAETIIELFRSSVKPTYVEEQKIIVRRRQADITKINRLLGFKPKVEIKDGLKDVVSDILAKPSYY
jgi:UDP-glucose 4-epimerase